jgi:ubiquinone/menaquinone biosynthesis C-methylase UbiE
MIGRRSTVPAIAVDVSASLIAEANRRVVGWSLPLSFEVGDAQAPRFADYTCDAVRTERMLMHVPNPNKPSPRWPVCSDQAATRSLVL